MVAVPRTWQSVCVAVNALVLALAPPRVGSVPIWCSPWRFYTFSWVQSGSDPVKIRVVLVSTIIRLISFYQYRCSHIPAQAFIVPVGGNNDGVGDVTLFVFSDCLAAHNLAGQFQIGDSVEFDGD